MLVRYRMIKEPVTIRPDESVEDAAHRMQAGGFRRLPVISDAKLVGIITDRDVRGYRDRLTQTKVKEAMTESPLVVATPDMTLEQAAAVMLEQQIGGLPVVDGGALVGIITASDVMRAFLDMMGASQGGSTRIDFILEGEEHGLVEASRIVAREGGEILGVGTYRDRFGDNPICYLRIIEGSADKIAKALRAGGFDILGVHRIGGTA